MNNNAAWHRLLNRLTRSFRIAVRVVFLLAWFFCDASAQDGSRDTNFTSLIYSMGSGSVNTLAVLPDDRIVFTISERIYRKRHDGTVDPSFTAGAASQSFIYNVAPVANGKILVGGSFSTFNKVPANCLVRLEFDGGIDRAFNIGSGPNSSVYHISVQPDGKPVVCGEFTTFNNLTRRGIVRLNVDGSVDTNFVATGITGVGAIYAVAAQADGNIIVAGSFTNFNGVARNRIARLGPNGGIDQSFTGPSLGGTFPAIGRIAVQPDGKVIIAGSFTTVGIGRTNVARLNIDGTIDETFAPVNIAQVNAIKLDQQGRLLVGSFACTASNLFFRLNSDGTVDTNFLLRPSLCASSSAQVRCIDLQSNGKILLFGNFTNSIPLVRLNATAVAAPPSLVQQPGDINCKEGETVALSVRATGYPLAFQWQRNGTNLFARTDAVLVLSPARQVNSGTYSVVVSNQFGTVISGEAIVTVNETAPVFTLQPTNTTTEAGWSATISAKALGLPKYQWFFNGSPLQGAIGTTVTIERSSGAHSGSYWVVASNHVAVITSQTATLSATDFRQT